MAEQRIYKVERGDTLEKISEKTGFYMEEIRQWHNLRCENVKDLIEYGGRLPKEILLPMHAPKTFYKNIEPNPHEKLVMRTPEENERIFLENLVFDKQARYRCEQVNTSNINGKMAHLVEQKFQYFLRQNLQQGIGRVKLEEHFYKFEPQMLNPAFEVLSKLEFIKNNVVFNISKNDGKIEKILNKKLMQKRWQEYRDNDFYKEPFIERLGKTNQNAVKELVKMGDTQFSENYKLAEEECRRNLFYFCCFDKWLYQSDEEMQEEEFLYMSTLVPPVVIPLKFRYKKLNENENLVKFSKIGALQMNEKLAEEIESKYDEIYKKNIQFGFTEYKLKFMIRVEFNKNENLIETANLLIEEQIADNIENICDFSLKRLKNYTS